MWEDEFSVQCFDSCWNFQVSTEIKCFFNADYQVWYLSVFPINASRFFFLWLLMKKEFKIIIIGIGSLYSCLLHTVMNGAACRRRSHCALFLVCRQAATRNQTEEDEDALSFSTFIILPVLNSLQLLRPCHVMSLPVCRIHRRCQAAIGLFLVVCPVWSFISCVCDTLVFCSLIWSFLFLLLENRTPVTFLPSLQEHGVHSSVL